MQLLIQCPRHLQHLFQPVSASVNSPATLPAPSILAASEKKLSESLFHTEGLSGDMYEGYMTSLNRCGTRMVEFQGLNEALLKKCRCERCGKPIELHEELYQQEWLATHMYYCFAPSVKTQSSYVTPRNPPRLPPSRGGLAINLICACQQVYWWGAHPSLRLFCDMLDLPLPVSFCSLCSCAYCL